MNKPGMWGTLKSNTSVFYPLLVIIMSGMLSMPIADNILPTFYIIIGW